MVLIEEVDDSLLHPKRAAGSRSANAARTDRNDEKREEMEQKQRMTDEREEKKPATTAASASASNGAKAGAGAGAGRVKKSRASCGTSPVSSSRRLPAAGERKEAGSLVVGEKIIIPSAAAAAAPPSKPKAKPSKLAVSELVVSAAPTTSITVEDILSSRNFHSLSLFFVFSSLYVSLLNGTFLGVLFYLRVLRCVVF